MKARTQVLHGVGTGVQLFSLAPKDDDKVMHVGGMLQGKREKIVPHVVQ